MGASTGAGLLPEVGAVVAPGTCGFEIISILLLSNSAQMCKIGCG
jgi:hypothetical protein